MNTLLINKYNFALQVVLMEKKEIKVQNMRIMFSKLINSFLILQQRRTSFL